MYRRAHPRRGIGLFADVRSGESGTALLLTAYYIVKPVREALILAGGGAEVKSYTSAGQALLLLEEAGGEAGEPIPPGGAFRLVMRDRYLLLIALLMLFLNRVNTTGEYILGRVVSRRAAETS